MKTSLLKKQCLIVVMLFVLPCLVFAATKKVKVKKGLEEISSGIFSKINKAKLNTKHLEGEIVLTIGKVSQSWPGKKGGSKQKSVRVELFLSAAGKNNVYYSFSVAVFDKKGDLLGAIGYKSTDKLEKKSGATIPQWIFMPESDIKNIKSFKATLYEAQDEFGS